MADKRYSIDEILDEYPKSSGEVTENTRKIDLDALLSEYEKNRSGEKEASSASVSLHNTDVFKKAVPPDLSDIKIELTSDLPDIPEQPEPPSDSFSRKYSGLSGKVSEIAGRGENSPEGTDKPAPKPKGLQKRSFSEKIEQDKIYPEDAEKEKKESISDRLRKLRKGEAPAEKEEEPVPETVSPAPEKENPFDKFESIAEGIEAEPEAEEKPAEKSLDDILAEYSASSNQKDKRSREYTHHKGITGFFTKIIPDSSDWGNTELLDGMKRMQKERMSRTQHISPIERKSIADIDLNLDDKILPDTSQFPVDKENSELDKLNALKERRSKKIKDFVLVGDEEDAPDEETDSSEPRTIEDFEAFEDAPSIAADIAQLKNSLAMRMLVLIICFAASMYIAIANDTGLLPIMDLLNKHTQTNTYLFVNAIIGLLAAFASYNVISCGLSKLTSLKADCDSLSAAAVVASIAETVLMFANISLVIQSIAHVYIAAAVLSLIFNTAGKLFIVSRTQRSFRFVSGSGKKYALFRISDEERAQGFTRGALRDFPELSSMRKTEFLTEFLKTSYASDSTDKFCRLFTPIILGASAVVAVLAGLTAQNEFGTSTGIYTGFSVFTGCTAMCSAVSTMLVVNLPMERASRKNHDLQGAVLGYECIEEFADTNSILIDAEKLFPQGSVNLSAIKVFSDTRIDEAIVEAASLTSQAGSILKNMFYDIIAGKTELLNPVESYIYEDSMGLCGWINNKRVLLGSRELMINHSIENVPSAAKEQDYTKGGKFAMYLSISGELSAMFIVELKPSMDVKLALGDLQKQEIYTVIRSVDSLVTINNLSELFDISPEYFKLLPFRLHPDFAEVTSYQPRQKASLACSGQFAAFTSLILSCRSVRGTISAGIAIESVSILLGILICIAMVVLKSFSELTVTMAVIYNLIFTAALLIFQMFRKN